MRLAALLFGLHGSNRLGVRRGIVTETKWDHFVVEKLDVQLVRLNFLKLLQESCIRTDMLAVAVHNYTYPWNWTLERHRIISKVDHL